MRTFSFAILFGSVLLGGCGGAALRGTVVDGSSAWMQRVAVGDERLRMHGIAGASIQLIADPQSLGRKVVAEGTARADGSFDVPVRQFGAGALVYEYLLVVRAPGYSPLVEEISIPRKGEYLLIELPAGADHYQPPADLMREAEHLFSQ